MTVIIAAAGTGGHVNPAIAVAEALRARHLDRDRVVFFGGDRFEAEAVPRAGFSFVRFELTRLHRRLTAENLKIPAVVRRTAAEMTQQMHTLGARAVLALGGYVAVPAVMAARRAAVPFFLQEQNALPGLASRFAARRARATFLGLPGRSERLPRSRLVGNPLPGPIDRFDREALRPPARERYGLPRAGPVLGVLGGSQGARVLNRSVGELSKVAGLEGVVHLTGESEHAETSRRAGEVDLPWRCVPFESEMEYFYAAVDLVVCRAGAMTVSELAATGTPAILVPLERVGQRANTALLAGAGAALVIEERSLGGMAAALAELVSDQTRLARMAQAAQSVARYQAAEIIAGELIDASGI